MPTTIVNLRDVPAAERTGVTYIGRQIGRGRNAHTPASPWANPFRIDHRISREMSIAWYALLLYSSPELMGDARATLAGRTLGCWCKPEACHGDVLARVCDLPGDLYRDLLELLAHTADAPWQWRLGGDDVESVRRLIDAGVLQGREASRLVSHRALTGCRVWRWADLPRLPGETGLFFPAGNRALVASPPEQCRYCGCHEGRACQDETRQGLPCHWFSPGVCSAPGCVALSRWELDRRGVGVVKGGFFA